MNRSDSVWLASAQRWTSRAGFGCAGLMGALSRRESLALLEDAWEAGVRHFDVAPLYGHGESERVLGIFLRGRRDQVTLVTKFGLEPTGHSTLAEMARAVVRPLASRIPSIRRASRGGGPSSSSRAPITAEWARRSLERSLRALQTEWIDVLLVHEPRMELLTDDELPSFLEGAVQKGLIRTFGIGGDSLHATSLFQSQPVYCPLVQCEWSVLESPPPSFPGSQVIVFGVLAQLRRALNTGRLRLQDNADLTRSVLRAAALALPESVILLSSRNRTHVRASVRAVCDATLDSVARQLLAQVGTSLSMGSTEHNRTF